MRRYFAFLLIALLPMLFADALVRADQPDPRTELQTIMANLPKVRQLDFKRPVPLELKTAVQVRDYFANQVQKEATPEEIRDRTEAGVMMALWPRNFLPQKVALNLEVSLLLGFYDPETGRMVVLNGDDAALSQVVDGDGKPLSFPYIKEMTLAHELTHALQDQHFDLSRIEKIRHDDDRQLAFRCIVEGDATLTGLIYTFKGVKSAQATEAFSEFLNMSNVRPREMVSVPDTITIPGGFVYGGGTRFVAYAYKKGGFAAVDELLRNPPTSTREIVHPEKFFGHPSPPEKVEIRGFDQSLKGWKLIDQNTIGEVAMVAMIHQNLGDAENWGPLGDSWRGDQLLLLDNGSARAIIGMITFDSPAMAAHFAETYTHILDQVHGDRVPHLVDNRDRTVLFVIGEPARAQAALTPAIWRASSIGTAPAPARVVRPVSVPAHKKVARLN